MRMSRSLTIMTLLVAPALAHADDAPRLRELRLQKQQDVTYFQARFDLPADMRLPDWNNIRFGWSESWRASLANVPSLVDLEGKARNVYWRPDAQTVEQLFRNEPMRREIGTASDGLEFIGRVEGAGAAKFRLLYPVRKAPPKKDAKPSAVRSLAWRDWNELEITLDFDKAGKPAVPEQPRKLGEAIHADDLQGLWASAQAVRLALLEGQTSDFSFYGFAREATRRKYNVAAPPTLGNWQSGRRNFFNQQLYETTTGSAAITESLQMHRMSNGNFRDTGERTIELATIPGIDIAEHPWKKMMGDKKPAPEPLARVVPADNYYIHFKRIDKFLELGELMDLWGTSLTRAYEVNSRDYDLKPRLEKQLCLRGGWMGKTVGPAVVKSVAVTGHDLYVREGSDVTVIFHVSNKTLFFSGVDQFIAEARKEHGTRLQESKDTYHDIAIENVRTPQREVSMHRCTLGDYVVYSNSRAGVRRVIDTQQGRLKPLADALDYQYMRTIFRLDDTEEDGFAFLSDAFIRQMVGPASKIKEKRRLEALTSLQMETNAALFTAWESGKLPDDHDRLLVSSTLKPQEIYMPEGKGLLWDQRRNVAISDVYNTIHFATPLIELPIDKVTKTEDQQYREFRLQYLGLWRQYFDPIGLRFALRGDQVKIDTYVLPLVRTTQYDEVRRATGGGTTKLDPAKLSPKSLVQFTAHLSENTRGLFAMGLGALGFIGNNEGVNWMGDWAILRFDDSDVYAKIAERLLKMELDPEGSSGGRFEDEAPQLLQMPVTLGVSVRNPLTFALFLTAVKKQVDNVLPGGLDWDTLDAYKDVKIVRIRPKVNGEVERFFKDQPKPAIYYALIDGGWYISLREEPIKDLIDQAAARREKKDDKKPETVAVNTSLYVAPGAAKKAGDFVQGYLEFETQRRAVGNTALWQCLYESGVIPANADAATAQRTARQFFGFVPASPDGVAYRYDVKNGEVVNIRHGSARQPRLNARLAEGAPLGQVLNQFQSLRADLRFREDGIHTVLTIQRRAAKP